MEYSDQETPQGSRMVISPSTSTPGLSPGAHLSTSITSGLKSSELLSSDESIVDTPKEKEMVVSTESINDYTLYKVINDDEAASIEAAKNSSIALRTRSKDLLNAIKFDIAELQHNTSKDIDQHELENSEEVNITSPKTVDSLILTKYQIKPDKKEKN